MTGINTDELTTTTAFTAEGVISSRALTSSFKLFHRTMSIAYDLVAIRSAFRYKCSSPQRNGPSLLTQNQEPSLLEHFCRGQLRSS